MCVLEQKSLLHFDRVVLGICNFETVYSIGLNENKNHKSKFYIKNDHDSSHLDSPCDVTDRGKTFLFGLRCYMSNDVFVVQISHLIPSQTYYKFIIKKTRKTLDAMPKLRCMIIRKNSKKGLDIRRSMYCVCSCVTCFYHETID